MVGLDDQGHQGHQVGIGVTMQCLVPASPHLGVIIAGIRTGGPPGPHTWGAPENPRETHGCLWQWHPGMEANDDLSLGLITTFLGVSGWWRGSNANEELTTGSSER